MTQRPIAVLVDSGSLVVDEAAVPPGWAFCVSDGIPTGPNIVALAVNPACGRVDRSHLRDLPDLRMVFTTSAGTDHLDLDAAAEFGIEVINNPAYCVDEVADHTIALILGSLRRTHHFDRAVHQGRWDNGAVLPRRVAGTRLGLWGFGAIGRAVARRALALDMEVIVHSRTDTTGDSSIRWVDRDELIGSSEVLSLHVPLTDMTRGLMDDSTFRRMRPGSYLINVSRGELVDEDALARHLESGHLAGAALDVLVQEPPVDPCALLGAAGAVVTPHVAWMSPDSVTKPFEQFVALLSDIDVSLDAHAVTGMVR
ncbi:NAD(P)-dependent oxidoreductase [Rhodococcus ruber]|uniref:NAD(P)-dependent oxidoreductase n=1 Tax=Rhodococcus ruber TaxID=1830 RepID=A0ABT4MKR4_9NOCA|nr:NAD(P)-dependent oxidoreductase [Rhodococcus ruber]MCZ4521567.1 NAD(P)-dependent oxidoreductase [Rhodococcus ruber]